VQGDSAVIFGARKCRPQGIPSCSSFLFYSTIFINLETSRISREATISNEEGDQRHAGEHKRRVRHRAPAGALDGDLFCEGWQFKYTQRHRHTYNPTQIQPLVNTKRHKQTCV